MIASRLFAAAAAAALSLTATAAAQAADDKAALTGVKEGKIVFDLTQGDGKALLERLQTVEQTHQELLAQGVQPHLVITIRGPATRLVQTDAEKVKPEDRPFLAAIAAKLAQLGKTAGVESIEQCSAAVRHQGTKPELVVPPIKVVGNSYISLMAYQSRGFAYIKP
jgi:intracellular sulfur oxidation DsrE/DsrF family protein